MALTYYTPVQFARIQPSFKAPKTGDMSQEFVSKYRPDRDYRDYRVKSEGRKTYGVRKAMLANPSATVRL